MRRSAFIKNTAMGAANLSAGVFATSEGTQPEDSAFRMKFSPDFGLFRDAAGADELDQIRWAYDHGFRAWECTSLKFRSVDRQEKISQLLQQKGMEFGQFVGTMTFDQVTFAGQDQSAREIVIKDVMASVEIAKRMNTKIIHNVLGLSHSKLPFDFQMAHAIALLRRIADIYEPLGLVMVMEPMNHRIDHPGMFLHQVEQAHLLAKAVNSPSVKILYDVYHVQIQEGNLLPILDEAWDEIYYFQLGDTPGRNEPSSGEINFGNVLQHIHDKGYRGFVGLEHGTSIPGKTGELTTLEAYRTIDPN